MKEIIILSLKGASPEDLNSVATALRPLSSKFEFAVLNKEIETIRIDELKSFLEGLLSLAKKTEEELACKAVPDETTGVLSDKEVQDKIIRPLKEVDDIKQNMGFKA